MDRRQSRSGRTNYRSSDRWSSTDDRRSSQPRGNEDYYGEGRNYGRYQGFETDPSFDRDYDVNRSESVRSRHRTNPSEYRRDSQRFEWEDGRPYLNREHRDMDYNEYEGDRFRQAGSDHGFEDEDRGSRDWEDWRRRDLDR